MSLFYRKLMGLQADRHVIATTLGAVRMYVDGHLTRQQITSMPGLEAQELPDVNQLLDKLDAMTKPEKDRCLSAWLSYAMCAERDPVAKLTLIPTPETLKNLMLNWSA